MIRTGWVLAALIAAAGCGKKGGGDGEAESGKPKVAVSIFPIYDITRRIAGDRLNVMLVLPPGKSEHGYEPTPPELAALHGVKLGIAVGLGMDEYLVKSANVFRLGEKLTTMPIDVEPISEEAGSGSGEPEEEEDHEQKGEPDPHVWLDPQLMQTGADLIAEQLATLDPAGKDTYTKNAAVVKESLKQLDGRLAERSKAWTQLTIVTLHGSMSYFAKRYNLRIAAVVQPLPGKEPAAAYIAEVLEAIRAGKATVLFTEPQLDKATGEIVAKAAGIRLRELDPVGGLPGRESYEALMTWNADQLDAVLKSAVLP